MGTKHSVHHTYQEKHGSLGGGVNDSGSTPRSWCMILRVSFGGTGSSHEPREWTLEPESRTSQWGPQIQKSNGLPSTELCRAAFQQRHLVVQMDKNNRSPLCIWYFKSRTKAGPGFFEKIKSKALGFVTKEFEVCVWGGYSSD